MIVKFVLIFFLGVLLGVIIKSLIKTSVGTLLIDKNNPDKDLYRFEINDLTVLDKKNYITLKINHHADLSQK